MTYTILALDGTRRAIGVAVASCSLAVGATVPMLDPNIGAVASQAWTNPSLRCRLLHEMKGGATADAAVASVRNSETGAAFRQVAALRADGAGSAHTGQDATGWRGHLVRDGLIALGNFLAGPEVLDEMIEAFGEPQGKHELAISLVHALAAGERAGGDARGRQSAAVLATELGSETALYDLRVDDDEDPVSRLAHLVELRRTSDLNNGSRVASGDRPEHDGRPI